METEMITSFSATASQIPGLATLTRQLSSNGRCRMASTSDDSVLNPKEVKILGVHKRDIPKKLYLFVILVKWSDGSEVIVYREHRDIKKLQQNIFTKMANSEETKESKKYLKKLACGGKKTSLPQFSGTMEKIRMIDSLNVYFQAAIYYKCTEYTCLREFCRPTSSDLNSSSWSGDGRTFFYITRDVLGQRNTLVDEEEPDAVLGRLSFSSEADSGIQEENTLCRFNALSNIDQPDSNISWPVHSEIFEAVCDHVASEDAKKENILSICRGDKFEVMKRCESGWWLVKRVEEDCETEKTPECGYVSGSFILPVGAFDVEQNSDAFSVTRKNSYSSDEDLTVDYTSDDSLQDSLKSEENFSFSVNPRIYELTKGDLLEKSDEKQPGSYDEKIQDLYLREISSTIEESIVREEESASSSDISSVESHSPLPEIDMASKNRNERRKNKMAKHKPPQAKHFRHRASMPVMLVYERNETAATLDSLAEHPLLRTEFGISLPDINKRAESRQSLSASSLSTGINIANSNCEYISVKKYQAQREDELSFEANAIISVLRKKTDGWWLASYQEQVGLVPGVYLKKYNNPFKNLGIHLSTF